MQIITKIIADGLLLPMAAIAAWVLVFRVPHVTRYQTYARLVMAGLTSYLAAKIVAMFFQPETKRPFEMMGVDPGAAYLPNPGFPSDHALFAMFLCIAVWYVTKSKKLTAVMLVLMLAVCVGRVAALVHTPLDVVGGVLIAFVGVVWLWRGFIPKRGKYS